MNVVALSKLRTVNVPLNIVEEVPEVAAAFKIDTPLRLSHFLAQCAHESNGFKSLTENLNYSADSLRRVFDKYFPGNLADQYERQPQAIGNLVYANRMGNGDTASGDGFRYRGRGAIQLTGKTNYIAFGRYVNDDVVTNPDLVSTKYPLLSAAWFWNNRSLNSIADKGATDDVVTAVTKIVNGGTNGLGDRLLHFRKYWGLLREQAPLEAA